MPRKPRTDTKVHDTENPDGHIPGRNGGTLVPFNSDTARLAVAAREKKKHEVMMRALNREVQPELIEEFGEYAFMAEGAVNMQRLATSPEAGKAAVMAFNAIMDHTGHGTRQALGAGEQAQGTGAPTVVLLLAELERRGLIGDVIDAEAGE